MVTLHQRNAGWNNEETTSLPRARQQGFKKRLTESNRRSLDSLRRLRGLRSLEMTRLFLEMTEL